MKELSISNIIMRNGKFNNKGMQVNRNLKQFCIEQNIFLVDHTKTLHPISISKSKLHLNKSRTSILSSNFVKAFSNILDWHEMEGNNKGNCEVEECNSFYQNALFNNEINSMRVKHVKKPIFTHLNINSLCNKFVFLVEFVKGK